MNFYHYRAYGFTVHSDREIPLIEKAAQTDAADILVHRREDEDLVLCGQNSEGIVRTSCLGSVLIQNGNEIITDFPGNLPVSFLCPGYIDTLIQQRGLFAFHGTAVCKNGRAVLITGEHGAGKSSLAAEFIEQGWKLMTDDVAILEPTEGNVLVRSGAPVQKLCRDTVELLGCPERILYPVSNGTNDDKFYLDRSEEYFSGSLPLDCVIAMKTDDDALSVRRIKGGDKLAVLQPLLLHSGFSQPEWSASMRFLLEVSSVLPLYGLIRNTKDSLKAEYETLVEACHLQ